MIIECGSAVDCGFRGVDALVWHNIRMAVNIPRFILIADKFYSVVGIQILWIRRAIQRG